MSTRPELNLPVIKKEIPPSRWLSMDDYVKFVNLNLKYTLNKKANKRWKKVSMVNVPFSLFS